MAGYHFEKPWSVFARYEFIADDYRIMDEQRVQLGAAYKPFKFLRLQSNLSYIMPFKASEDNGSFGFNLLVTAMF